MSETLIAQLVADYRIVARLGQGASAAVYEATHVPTGRLVALKVMSLALAPGSESEAFQRRFAREAELIASLEHPHILPIYDYGIVKDLYAYIAMRLLRGGSLHDRLRAGALTVEQTVEILTQVGSGLAYAHLRGVIHRDLKPSNVLFDEDGRAYLVDFGLARVMKDGQPELTDAGTLVGTPAYVSPEALRGETVDQRSDIYSLGVLAYQMLTGHLPFESRSLLTLIRKHLEDAPPPMRTRGVPYVIEAVIRRALAKQPRNRYWDVQDMIDALKLAHTSGRLATTRSRWTLRRRVVTSAALAAFAVLVIVMRLLAAPLWLPHMPTIVPDTVGTSAESVPSLLEISAARARLGETGFVAHIACTLETEYNANRAREMGERLAGYGLAYRVYDSQGDAYRQLTMIERARIDGATALLLCPIDSRLLTPSLTSLHAAQLPVVFTTQMDTPPELGVQVALDNYETGRRVGAYAAQIVNDELGETAAVVVYSRQGNAGGMRRAAGMIETVQALAPGVTIVGEYEGWDRETGRRQTEQLLRAGVDFDLMLVREDSAALGAIEALEAAGVPPDAVYILSVGGEQLAQEYMRDGHYLRATLLLNRTQGSDMIVDVMVRALAGATLPAIYYVPIGDLLTSP